MLRFDPSSYYLVTSDESIVQKDYDNIGVSLQEASGRQVILDYYHEKYDCNIEICEPDIKQEEIWNPPDIIANNVPKLLQKAREEARGFANYRKLFYFIITLNGHATPVLYIKENNEEALLVSDSVYSNSQIIERVKNRVKDPDVENMFTPDIKRQTDNFSCFAELFIFARYATGKINGEYIIPNLLAQLKANKKNQNIVDGCTLVMLPKEFLKTVQYEGYDRDLTFNAYTDKKILVKSKKGIYQVDLLSYLRIKGIKFAHYIARTFYESRLAALFESKWTDNLRKKFIDSVKISAKETWKNDLGDKHGQLLAGLHSLSVDFYLENNDHYKTLNYIYQILFSEEYWKSRTHSVRKNFPDFVVKMQVELRKLFEYKDGKLLMKGNGIFPDQQSIETSLKTLACIAQDSIRYKEQHPILYFIMSGVRDDDSKRFLKLIVQLSNDSAQASKARHEIEDIFINMITSKARANIQLF